MKPAIIFDLDGTLVDSAPDLQAAVNQWLSELDKPALSLAQVTGYIGHEFRIYCNKWPMPAMFK